MRDRLPGAPRERAATPREAIRAALLASRELGATATALELSAAVGIPEREVTAHLEHLARSLKHDGYALAVTAAKCLACGFTFDDRARYTAPSACPQCRSERIAPPSFGVGGSGVKARAAKPPRGDDDDD